MKVAYDLIIIGNLAQSLLIAEYALRFQARTALINLNYLDDKSLFLNKYKNHYLINESSLNYDEFVAEEQLILDQYLISHCQQLGLDIINDQFKFIPNKKLAIQTSRDIITTSDYLLNIPPEVILFDNYHSHLKSVTLDQIILENKWSSLPTKIAIIGQDITAIYLAIRLINLGKDISLFSTNNCLLPYEDEDISWQLQLYLEAQGIKFHFSVINYQHIDIDTQYEQVIFTETDTQKKPDRLQLNNLGIKIDRHKIIVNSKLQTDNPNIYACGDSLGGYRLDNISEYESKIAVKNALFIPWQHTDYSQIPYCLPTNPPIYHLGCTEKQARLLYGKGIKIIRLHSSLISSSSFMTNNSYHSYFLKIILNRSQQIVGFHCLGDIPEILPVITSMIKNNQPLDYLFKLNFTHSITYEIVKDIQQKWQQEKQKKSDIITDLTKTFLIWKNG